MTRHGGVGRDRALERALAELPVPAHAPGFFDRLESALRDEPVAASVARPGRGWLVGVAAAAAVVLAAVGVAALWPSASEPALQVAGSAGVVSREALADIVPRPADVSDGWVVLGPDGPDLEVLRGMLRPDRAAAVAAPSAGFVGAELTRFRTGDAGDVGVVVHAAYLFDSADHAARAFEIVADAHGVAVDGTPMTVLEAPRVGDEALRLRGDWNGFYPGQARTITVWRVGPLVLDLGTTGLSLAEHEEQVAAMHDRAIRAR